jgi:hypothetical protein
MPAKSKAQQRLMGLVRQVQLGKSKAPSKEIARMAEDMDPADVKDFASTKHKGLPARKVAEMNKHSYTEYLTEDELKTAVKLGVASHMQKHAQITDAAVDAVTAAAVISLLGGIPLGAAAHHIDKKIKGHKKDEKKRLGRIRNYRLTSKQLKDGLMESF